MKKPKVKLVGIDGNVFSIIGACLKAARKAGWSQDQIDAVRSDMESGDYNHVLQVAIRNFDVS